MGVLAQVISRLPPEKLKCPQETFGKIRNLLALTVCMICKKVFIIAKKSQDCDVAAIALCTLFICYMNLFLTILYHVSHFSDFGICFILCMFNLMYAYHDVQDHLNCMICTLITAF